jgi:hypothetical protein
VCGRCCWPWACGRCRRTRCVVRSSNEQHERGKANQRALPQWVLNVNALLPGPGPGGSSSASSASWSGAGGSSTPGAPGGSGAPSGPGAPDGSGWRGIKAANLKLFDDTIFGKEFLRQSRKLHPSHQVFVHADMAHQNRWKLIVWDDYEPMEASVHMWLWLGLPAFGFTVRISLGSPCSLGKKEASHFGSTQARAQLRLVCAHAAPLRLVLRRVRCQHSPKV